MPKMVPWITINLDKEYAWSSAQPTIKETRRSQWIYKIIKRWDQIAPW